MLYCKSENILHAHSRVSVIAWVKELQQALAGIPQLCGARAKIYTSAREI